MRKILSLIVILTLSIFSLQAKEIKLLTIGNSFADSLFVFLPDVVKSAPDCEILMERANHPGCPLERHWSYVEKEEANPNAKMYRKNSTTLKEILKSQKWDVVTIQQASPKSWDFSTYFPYAQNLKNYINKNAPSAEVVIQQTWAYREDDRRISKGGEWGFDQNGMFERIEKAYAQAAKQLGVRMIPSGKAVQLAREKQKVKFKNYDPKLLETLKEPELPNQEGSLVGTMSWKKGKDGKKRIARDTIHLNDRGRYLQACVWFAFLFDKPTSEITFKPSDISEADALFLRQIAQEAIDSIKAKKN